MRRCWGIERSAGRTDGFGAAADPTIMGGDRYVLWLIRRMVLCAGDPDPVEWSLCRRLGVERGREAYLALRLLLYAVCMFGRRPLRLAPPWAAERTPDEAVLLQLVAAAQHGDDDLLDLSLSWLLKPKAPLMPENPVRRLAGLLSGGAVVLAEPPNGSMAARVAR